MTLAEKMTPGLARKSMDSLLLARVRPAARDGAYTVLKAIDEWLNAEEACGRRHPHLEDRWHSCLDMWGI